MSDPIDYDGAWKEALEHYLQPFLELCFPEVANAIDWSVPAEFLDTELQEVVRDADLGKQRADKLVKVQRREGPAEWVLIHVEIQAQPDEELPRRVYRYHHRIVDRFGHQAATLVVLADERAGWRPSVFEEELWQCQVRFQYPVCKLLDFKASLLERDTNPAAIVVAAHRAAQRTRGDTHAARRKKFKWELVRRLYDRGYDRGDVLELYRLIDWLLVLPEPLEIEFQQTLRRYAGEKNMPHITSIERLAHEEGLLKGRNEGLLEGRNEGRNEGRKEEAAGLLLRLARKRFPGQLDSRDEEALGTLPLNRLEDLSEALLDFTGVENFRLWLRRK